MKKTIFTLVLLAFIGLSTANAQLGIGTTTPDASSILDVTSTEKGFLPPRMDNDQRDAINLPDGPTPGLVIYNTTVNCLQWYNGTGWFDACDGSTVVPPGPLSDCAPGFIPPFLTAAQTVVKDVTNPITGDTWMDRNLGAYTADRTPPSPAGGTDCWAYGNLYQWGRNSDGHESRLLDCTTGDCFDAGGVNTTLPATAAAVTATTWAGKFIYGMAFPLDWHNDNPDNTLWTSTGGPNNPCPSGYRVPTETELDNERSSWGSNNNREGAITSALKLSVAGIRLSGSGGLSTPGIQGRYWSSTTSGFFSSMIIISDVITSISTGGTRATGHSVRCIKD